MGGGLLQLVAYGAQDVYLTGNPQITFFKVVYRRHTNFAIESIQQTFNGVSSYGSQISVTVSRNGDLINRAYIQVNVPKLSNYDAGSTTAPSYVNYYGLRLLKDVVVEIGGQQIDKHYADWMYIWNELSLPVGKKQGYDLMVGADGEDLSAQTTDTRMLYIPLEFWFCRNVGLALPLIALQYHEVKFKINFESIDKCINNSSGITDNKLDASMWIDYIFLDTDERRRFAQLSHEYLIEQLQFTGQENLSVSGNNRYKLNFNHPCKELVWVSKNSGMSAWYNYTNAENSLYTAAVPAGTDPVTPAQDATVTYPVPATGSNPITNCLLQLNGNDRFAVRDGSYFNFVQPYQHHTNIPTNKGINVYSFALKPEEHQPSGTLNMSRIDTAVLSLEARSGYLTGQQTGTLHIYALNYNVLRIMSGMGGLAYSN